MPRVLVIDCPALAPEYLADPAVAPNLHRMSTEGACVSLAPTLPAVTCSVQASILTGRPPGEHGIVANGFYERDLAEVRFWEQSARLVDAPPFWTRLKPRPTVAMLFWQNSLYADVDCMLTPKPLHTDAGLVNDCYGRPADLYPGLREALGEFPLHHYWGPLAALPSSDWIARATEHVWREQSPELCLTYLPHLDYNTQRRGPAVGGLAEDITALDRLVGRLAQMAADDGAEVVVLSEYGLSPVTRAVALNRHLRQAGLAAIREVAGREYLDFGASQAFAMVDHQVAHLYCVGGARGETEAAAARAREVLSGIDGVAEVLTLEEQDERGANHHRSGELLCIAEPDAWFSYYWWLDDDRAPDFARTVDIHHKPGYDAVELFADPATRSIPLEASLVRGSHGRAGPGDPTGVFLTSHAEALADAADAVAATEVAEILARRLRPAR